MSFHVGEKESIKVKYEKLGYKYLKAVEIAAYDKVLIENVELNEGYNEEKDTKEIYGAIVGTALKSGGNGDKVWFYIPNVDNAGLLDASPEDLELISTGNYSYTIVLKERANKSSGKSPTYAVGTLNKE